MQFPEPYCYSCKHYRGAASDDPDAPATCDAFPDGIPQRIFEGSVDHREPFPDDNGIRFEKVPAAPPIPDDRFGVPFGELA